MNVLRFADKWDFNVWFDLGYNKETQKWETAILLDDENGDETSTPIQMLKDVAVLYDTEQEFLRNVKQLINQGLLSKEVLDDEWLLKATKACILEEDIIPEFTEQESATGLFALKVVRLLQEAVADFNEWWGDALAVKYVTDWNSGEKMFTPVLKNGWVYSLHCDTHVALGEEDLPALLEALEDVCFRFRPGNGDDVKGRSMLEWAAVLFVCRTQDIHGRMNSHLKRSFPEPLEGLFKETAAYNYVDY